MRELYNESGFRIQISEYSLFWGAAGAGDAAAMRVDLMSVCSFHAEGKAQQEYCLTKERQQKPKIWFNINALGGPD
jgi:hypothetical protein